MQLAVVLGLLALVAAPSAKRPRSQNLAKPTTQTLDRLPGFAEVVASQVAATVGTDNLARAEGQAMTSGMLVTLTKDRIMAFDDEIAPLAAASPATHENSAECDGRCSTALYDGFQAMWLALAIESTQRGVEIPARVLFAADQGTTVHALLATVYSAAASRPVRPPELALVVTAPRQGLRTLPFFVLPPQGLELGQGSAALGLTLQIAGGKYHLTAEDPRFSHGLHTETLSELGEALREVKRRHPGKQAIILVPDAAVTVGDLAKVIAGVRGEFPRVILSAGQDVVLP